MDYFLEAMPAQRRNNNPNNNQPRPPNPSRNQQHFDHSQGNQQHQGGYQMQRQPPPPRPSPPPINAPIPSNHNPRVSPPPLHYQAQRNPRLEQQQDQNSQSYRGPQNQRGRPYPQRTFRVPSPPA